MTHKRREARLLMRVALLVLIASLTTVPLQALAGNSKLVSMPTFGDVESFEISPDGAYVVYLADADTDDVIELYSVPLSGGTPVRLNDTPVTGGDVHSFEISPGGSRVVYRADQDTNDVYELYSVPIAGPAGDGVKLNPALPTGGDVQREFEISPDGSWVVYRADQDSVRTAYDAGGVYELYSVPIAGPASAGVKINHLLRFEVHVCMPGEDLYTDDVVSFTISPDSSRVVYRAKRYEGCDHVYEVFSVPIGGPASDVLQLNGTLVTGGDVSAYDISADSSRVVYRADQDTNDVYELYSVPIAGPADDVVQLNGTLVTSGDVSAYGISADSSRVVYRADQDTNGVYELYSVPITGPAGSGVKITDPVVYGGSLLHVNNFELSSDGGWVLYQANLDDTHFYELYSVPIAGPADDGVKLNRPLPSGAYGLAIGFEISPDSSRVVYHADQDTVRVLELYSVPIAGPSSSGVKLNGPLVDGGQVLMYGFQISPDSSKVVYRADQETDNVDELYSVPTTGPASDGVRLNDPLVAGGDVYFDYQISPDSSQVVYQADQDTDDVVELYVAGVEHFVYLPLVLR